MALQRPRSQSSFLSQVARLARVPENADVDALQASPISLSDESSTSVTDEESSARSRVQNVWDSAVNKSMKVPDTYEDVAVLIIKWDEKLDELKCGPEVKELDALFQERFRYQTQILNLGDSELKPQKQLNRDVSHFIAEHDGPNNLIIIFYTGHGSWDKCRNVLDLHAKDWSQGNTNEHPAKACWEPAERALMEGPEGDVLAIFDTCYASNVQKGVTSDARSYQLIAASSYDQPTAAPGQNSFTTALIKSLKELLDRYENRPFTVWDLQDQINHQKERRDSPCMVHNRLRRYNDRYLRLAPLPSKAERATRRQSFHTEPFRAFFTLRFALTDGDIEDEQIRKLAEKLCNACETLKIPARRIDMISFRDSIKHNRLKSVTHALIAIQSRLRRSTLESVTSVSTSVPQLAWVTTERGPPSPTIPLLQLINPSPIPDPSKLAHAYSSAQEEEAPTSKEMSGARRSLWHIEINTALLVLMSSFLVIQCMNQTWWHDIFTQAQDRAKDIHEVVNALLAQAKARDETADSQAPFMPGFAHALKRWRTW
ncbi:hypothetical protein W97_01531 [Coniosporium apollinis CBS 100218]|uniref:Uncharacterized protein n=1 Tax=Coniosporium apollinis (strain CBS 100218) TaxID=1168221 RepID=R7YK84_CONA1|nr:uncharacterized protein W97_01531 [Coniosporium apollinis CBS 100218]EON62310.1 hypothetical protein W97_01531 [Coniosporium apollinis CBS 100218]